MKIYKENHRQVVSILNYCFFPTFLYCEGLKFVLEILIVNLLWSPEENKSEAVENKLSNLASDNASNSLYDATLHQIEDKMQTENFTAVHESLGEGEGPYYYLQFYSLF